MSFLNIIGQATKSLILDNPLASGSILVSIALIVIIAAILAFISRLLKQDFILAYILAGVLMGPLVLGLIQDPALINGLAEIGITFLLFAAGLEMSLSKFKGRISTIALAGIIQIISVIAFSFFLFKAFNFNQTESIWLGISIALSSTVVVTKILSDKNELNTLHARFIMGIMFVQDLVAIIALALLSKEMSIMFILLSVLKILGLALLAFLTSKAMKPVLKKAASSSELLLIITLAFLFLFSSIAYFLKLSIAIGAFMAGIMLANTEYKIEINSKTKTLRDFFAIMFFVSVGMWLTNVSRAIVWPLIGVIAVLVVFEPLVTALVIRLRGYKSKTSLEVGFAFAQISEFSLILMLSALNLGIVSQTAFDLIVLSAVISIAITQYTVKIGDPLSRVVEKTFSFIKVSKYREAYNYSTPGKKSILLIGCHRMGTVYLKNLEQQKENIIVLDYNPEIIKALARQRISAIYGDSGNEEMLKQIPLKDMKIVVSAVPQKEDNLFIIQYFKKISKNIHIIVTAHRIDDAFEFYRAGADYVLLPMIIGAEQCLNIMQKLSKKDFSSMKREHIDYLKDLHGYLY
jgi:Kef-type K+ transport system membrane component KefB